MNDRQQAAREQFQIWMKASGISLDLTDQMARALLKADESGKLIDIDENGRALLRAVLGESENNDELH